MFGAYFSQIYFAQGFGQANTALPFVRFINAFTKGVAGLRRTTYREVI